MSIIGDNNCEWSKVDPGADSQIQLLRPPLQPLTLPNSLLYGGVKDLNQWTPYTRLFSVGMKVVKLRSTLWTNESAFLVILFTTVTTFED